MPYCFGTWELDATPLLLKRAGEVVPLPPKALEILLLLVQNEGKVISKEEIFNKVWPDTHVVESSLTKNISILRKVLDDPDQPSLIENLPKRGYRFTLSLNPHIPNQRSRILSALFLFVLILIATFLYFRPKSSPITEADREILIGRHHWHRIQPDEIQKALKRFERAAALEPNSALAQAGIADANLLLLHLGFSDPAKSLSAARIAANRSLALDPKLSIAHVSAGMVAATTMDWAGAHRELDLALELDPNSSSAHRAYGFLFRFEGRFVEARKSFERSLAIDPISAWSLVALAQTEYADHKFERALMLFDEVLDREPNFRLALYSRALTKAYLGKEHEALADLSNSKLSEHLLATDKAWIQARFGNPKLARELLDKRLARWRTGQDPPSAITILALALGDHALALESLQSVAARKGGGLLNLRMDPRLDPIRGEPGFLRLLAKYSPAFAK